MKKDNCKHNGKKSICNIYPGFKCMQCGEEIIKENGKLRIVSNKEIKEFNKRSLK